MESENGIKVNFSSAHATYYSAYKYVTKEDEHFVVSSGHPELSGPPATEEATKTRKAKLSSGKGKRERYATFDVVEIIRRNKIKSRLELINLALRQKEEGKTVLVEFIANRGQKIVNEALNLAKEFDKAPQTLARMRKSRVQLLKEAENV